MASVNVPSSLQTRDKKVEHVKAMKSVRLKKAQLIELLRNHKVNDAAVIDAQNVSEENLILILHQNKIRVEHDFFKELAKKLDLPFIEIEDLKIKCNIASIMPYKMLKENLSLPLEVSSERVKIVTSNPLNNKFFLLLENVLRKRIELFVAPIESVEQAIEQGYEKIHNNRALKELYYRHPEESAYNVLYPWQRKLVLGLLFITAILFVVNYPLSFILVFAVINIIYFCVNPVKFYVSLRGFKGSRRAVCVSHDDVEKLDEESLPIYTILVPVYREAKVLRHILQNIYKMNYPKHKLDVKILMEEKDRTTIREAIRLGLFGDPETVIEPMTPQKYEEFLKTFDAVIVPDAPIKTKPRACNFGLLRAKGEYCVIYDAEDDPDPDQLKKAVIAFSRVGKDCVCLQSRLNFYNPKENLLSRWFSLEYSYWFDYYLEGLDQVGAPLPLGGTSNHFRTNVLRDLGGWDPYNVTEDADLGMRIARSRLKTAMLNSYTFEEANSRVWNWIRQRSRWNKGYIQTYIVHMRHPRELIREMGWKQFLYFQLTFGGNIVLPLVNPLLWTITLLTLLIPGIFQFLFFYPIVYVCMVNLIIGNSVYIALHMGPYLLKKNYRSIPVAIAIPFYWVLVSIGAWKGTIQLIRKPFYWEKTEHGLSEDDVEDVFLVKKREQLVHKIVIEDAKKIGQIKAVECSTEGRLMLIIHQASKNDVSLPFSKVEKIGDVVIVRSSKNSTSIQKTPDIVTRNA